MKKTLVVFILISTLVFSCFAADNQEIMKHLLEIVAFANDFSKVVIIDQDYSVSPIKTNEDYKLVIIGPNCHKLPGWCFYGNSIDYFINLSPDLRSANSLSVFCDVDIKNSYSNLPLSFLEQAVIKALSIDSTKIPENSKEEIVEEKTTFSEVLDVVAKAESLSGFVILNSDCEYIPVESGGRYKLVIIGPDCHRLVGWTFYGGSIETLISFSSDLRSSNSLSIFCDVDINSSFSNLPISILKPVIEKTLNK